jgi:hypothetical protein
MAEKFTRWDASDHLKTEEDITAYFEACLDDDPGDGSLVRTALRYRQGSQYVEAGQRYRVVQGGLVSSFERRRQPGIHYHHESNQRAWFTPSCQRNSTIESRVRLEKSQ